MGASSGIKAIDARIPAKGTPHSGESWLPSSVAAQAASPAAAAEWAGVPLQRGFGPAFAEADPAELPEI